MLWFIFIRINTNKTTNEIMPPFGQSYKLHQYPNKKYASIDECLITELSLPKDVIHELIDDHRQAPEWKSIKDKDITTNLKNENDPLTEDERFAIALYSSHPIFYNSLSHVLNLGITGHYNCFFQYLISGFNKLKDPLTEKTTLYRGVSQMNDIVNFDNYKKGDIVQTTSFTSSSLNRAIGLRFASGSMIFKITGKRNPKDIQKLSFFPNEDELLYPPATKFKVINDPYVLYCTIDYDKKTSDCKDSEVHDYYDPYVFIDIEELDDDFGPIETIKNDEDDGSCGENKHLGVDWWGWLLIGVALGIVLLGIIWIISYYCCCRNKSERNFESNNEEL